jgi:hypothetical protein
VPIDRLTDAQAKDVLRKWPVRTKKVWSVPMGQGFWVRAQPVDKPRPAYRTPTLAAPGAKVFKTQPDGMWICFFPDRFCDIIVVEVCGSNQNLNDKRSRYMGASNSLLVECGADWFTDKIMADGRGMPRWRAAGLRHRPKRDRKYAVRGLRVLFALPTSIYDEWGANHVPMGHEFFFRHSSLGSYNAQKMQAFLGSMSVTSQFYTRIRYADAGTVAGV